MEVILLRQLRTGVGVEGMMAACLKSSSMAQGTLSLKFQVLVKSLAGTSMP